MAQQNVIRDFKFQLPIDDEANTANWRIMIANEKAGHYTPTFTGFTGAAPAHATGEPSMGYFFLLGPAVYIHIHFLTTATTAWGANSTISLPFNAFAYGGGTTSISHRYPLYTRNGAAAPVVNQIGEIRQKDILLVTAQVAFGAVIDVSYSGWYFRG